MAHLCPAATPRRRHPSRKGEIAFLCYIILDHRDALQLAETLEFLHDHIHCLAAPEGTFRPLLDPRSTYTIDDYHDNFDRLLGLLRSVEFAP